MNQEEILDFMPRALTAENGAKYALNGYFNEKVKVPNPDFCGCGECDYCKEFPETPDHFTKRTYPLDYYKGNLRQSSTALRATKKR